MSNEIDVTDTAAMEALLEPIERDIASMEADALEAARKAHRWGLKRMTMAEIEYIQKNPGFSQQDDESAVDRDDPTDEEDTTA